MTYNIIHRNPFVSYIMLEMEAKGISEQNPEENIRA